MVAVHTLNALGTDDRFVTSSIPVGVPKAGEEARTVYSPAASRLSTELRTPSPRGSMRTFIEGSEGKDPVQATRVSNAASGSCSGSACFH